MDRRQETSRPARSRYLPRRSTSWRDLPFDARPFLLVRLPELDAAALLHVVPRIHRQLADDITADHRLATEARMRGQPPRGVEAVGFVVLHLAEMLGPLFDDHMTGRAGTASAARVLERDAEIFRDVEERLGLAVVRVRQLAMLELDGLCLVVDDERDFRHIGPQSSFTLFPESAA